MKKRKILAALISLCAMATLSFTAVGEKKVVNLKNHLKNEYKIDYLNVSDVQKEIENALLKHASKKEDKETLKNSYKFGTCIGQLFENSKVWSNNKKEKFKDFAYNNFVKNKFDFVNYDKSVFKKGKEYFEDAYKKSSDVLKNFPKQANKKPTKEVEEIIKMNFENLMKIFKTQGKLNNKQMEKIKKDFKNRNSEFYEAFVEETKNYVKDTNKNFETSLKFLDQFEKDKNFRKEINKEVQKLNLKEYYNVLNSLGNVFKN